MAVSATSGRRSYVPSHSSRIKRWAWPQIDRFVVDETQVMLELWDGTYERLPEVAETAKLVNLLERIAAGRKIQVTKLKSATSGI